jgi:hypothetical protein
LPPSGNKRSSRVFDDNYIVKVGPSSTHKELLQAFELRGSSAAKIYASAEFSKFVTIDDAGLLYILEEIQPLQLK